MAFTQSQVQWVDGETVPVLDPVAGAFTQSQVQWVDGETIPVLDPEAGDGDIPIRDTILFGLL